MNCNLFTPNKIRCDMGRILLFSDIIIKIKHIVCDVFEATLLLKIILQFNFHEHPSYNSRHSSYCVSKTPNAFR